MAYYDLALSHKSLHQAQNKATTDDNERLEFLGDSVLSTVVADILYKRYPEKSEGELTNMRSKLVCRATLDKLGISIGLDQIIKMNRRSHINLENAHICGNAFEALMGAIYLDKGYKQCYKFINNTIFEKYLNIDEVATADTNYKSAFIELMQKEKLSYSINEIGEEADTAKNTIKFKMQICVEDREIGYGEGTSKKLAQQQAARDALSYIKKNNMINQLRALKDKNTQESLDDTNT